MEVTSPVEKLSILGIPITVFRSYDHAVDCVIERIRRRKKTFCVAINPEKVYRARLDAGLKGLIHAADFHICDGVGVAIAARILYGRKVRRVTGVQLFFELTARAAQRGLSVFLLGASAESNEGAYRRLLQMHPQLQIAGRHDGFFDDDEAMVHQINESGADMLFVAMGSPRQEIWIARHREALETPFCMSVGGTLDVVSGRVEWAPKVFRKTGTEFLYRLAKEPKRWKRQICYPVFMLQVIGARMLMRT
ncbi:MAG: WecB/TagA/CpsF family glycosyltransferase [Pirellulales bacterium]|nr:WecB/TagA/CpsF family glycosyltransferase [Pirellulales bacterium]